MTTITAFNGSHRSEKGFTQIALNQFLQGAKSKEAQCELMYPSKQKIIACESCGKCLFETPGECKYNDDMQYIISKMENCDLIVFASPVYFDSMSSNLKKMIERLRVTLDAYFEFRNGRTYHLKTNEKKQKVITLFTAGNPEQESFTSIKRIFDKIIDNMGWKQEAQFLFPASHLLAAKPDLLSSQLEALYKCGQQFALENKIDKNLVEKANESYVNDPKETLKEMTQTILQIRKENQNKKVH